MHARLAERRVLRRRGVTGSVGGASAFRQDRRPPRRHAREVRSGHGSGADVGDVGEALLERDVEAVGTLDADVPLHHVDRANAAMPRATRSGCSQCTRWPTPSYRTGTDRDRHSQVTVVQRAGR